MKKHQYYTVYFGDNEAFCSCTSHGFRKPRLICKHLLAIIQCGKKDFQDLSKLYLDHPLTNLDADLFRQSEQFGIPNALLDSSGFIITIIGFFISKGIK